MSADEITLRQLAEDTGLSTGDVHRLVEVSIQTIAGFAEQYPDFSLHDDVVLPEVVVKALKESRQSKLRKKSTLTLQSASQLTLERQQEKSKQEEERQAEMASTASVESDTSSVAETSAVKTDKIDEKASATVSSTKADASKSSSSPSLRATSVDRHDDDRDRRHDEEDEDGALSKRKAKKAAKKAQRSQRSSHEHVMQQAFEKPVKKQVKDVFLPESITVSDLAQLMSVKATEVIKELMKLGMMATLNQALDRDTATLVVSDMGHNPIAHDQVSIEDELLESFATQAIGKIESRPPVVTIMGHVDHGKTTLLDTIRKTRVAAGEAGGITQHIGAYHVDTIHGMITFIDTPGHEAFTEMRARGAKSTDIVILIVAADDGVMPQTEEAIQHAKAAEVPIIVAVNKMDKEGADPDRIKSELASREVVPEDWGGDVPFVPISALSGQGIEELLAAISLQAEVMELTARSEGAASGMVLESRMTKGRGAMSSVLIQAGQLRVGDMVLAGEEVGRVRNMISDTGCDVEAMGPSMPVEIIGLSGVAKAGDLFWVIDNERKAREVAAFRAHKSRQARFTKQAGETRRMFDRIQTQSTDVINVVIRADVHGSLAAINDALQRLQHDEVRVHIIAANVGPITESDVNLALASSALLLAFNVKADATARRQMDVEGIKAEYFSVIYDLIDFVRQVMSGRLSPVFQDDVIGKAEVKAVFGSSSSAKVAGCLVVDGQIKANAMVRILRGKKVLHEGDVKSLRRFTDAVSDVKAGSECGVGVAFSDIAEGDVIECFVRREVERQI